jgi:hypothetical protein
MSDHSGDGLFLKRDVPANTTLSFYNGIRVKPGEKEPFEDTGYQIYIDTNKGSVSIIIYFLNLLFSFS